MSILISPEILTAIEEELRSAKESVQVISAYCKLDAFESLSKKISSDVCEKRAMFRFRLDDIISGSTDFDILEYCLRDGWKVWIRFDLHAKTYIVDSKRGIVGSANATNSGLGLSPRPNSEMATLIDVSESDLKKINDLYSCAVPVDSDLISVLRKEVIRAGSFATSPSFLRWSGEIEKMFCPVVTTLFSYELPDRDHFSLGDFIDFLDVEYGSDEQIAERLRWSNAFLWLHNVLSENNGELYFGTLTSLLHESLVEDPKPYRRDVKEMLSNLLSFIGKWNPGEIVIDRPNHSQRVRLVVA